MSDNTVDLVLEYPQWAAARLAYLEEHVVRLERERDQARAAYRDLWNATYTEHVTTPEEKPQ